MTGHVLLFSVLIDVNLKPKPSKHRGGERNAAKDKQKRYFHYNN